MSAPNSNLTITDDSGDSRRITVRIPDRQIPYNKRDIGIVIDACLAVMEDCLRRGEELTFYGFGSMGLKWRAPRMVKAPMSDEWTEIPGHYVPNFKFGNVFQSAVKIYEQSLRESKIQLPDPVYDMGDEGFDFDAYVAGSFDDEDEEDEIDG